MHPVVLVLGIFAGQIFGLFLIEDGLWRWMFGLPAFLCLLQVLGLAVFAVESPPTLVAKGKIEEAREALQWLNRPNIDSEIRDMQAGDSTEISIYQLLCTQEVRLAWRSVLVAVTLHVLLQLSGISGIFYYSNDIFAKLDYSDSTSTALSVGLGAVNFAFTLSTIVLVERFGRRSLLMAGISGQLLFGLLICIFAPTLELVGFLIAIYFYIAFFAIGLGCIPWILMAELVIILDTCFIFNNTIW